MSTFRAHTINLLKFEKEKEKEFEILYGMPLQNVSHVSRLILDVFGILDPTHCAGVSHSPWRTKKRRYDVSKTEKGK